MLNLSSFIFQMGTRAGYITVDWEKVDADMRTASEQISEKIAEQQQNEETQELLKKVSNRQKGLATKILAIALS